MNSEWAADMEGLPYYPPLGFFEVDIIKIM
jgi:hypothetical protein